MKIIRPFERMNTKGVKGGRVILGGGEAEEKMA